MNVSGSLGPMAGRLAGGAVAVLERDVDLDGRALVLADEALGPAGITLNAVSVGSASLMAMVMGSSRVPGRVELLAGGAGEAGVLHRQVALLGGLRAVARPEHRGGDLVVAPRPASSPRWACRRGVPSGMAVTALQ